MQKGYIAVLDSGIGGISVLKKLATKYPNENYLYLGDSFNAPYGNKNVRQLFDITKDNIDVLKRYPIKAVVLGCNTLSVNLRKQIEEYAGLKVLGVYPPVETTLAHKKRTLLLSTVRTAENYKPTDNFHILGLKNLAFDIENNAFSLNAVNLISNLRQSVGKYFDKKGFYDTVILGCTHYDFIKNRIFDHFCPQEVISGVDFLVKNAASLLCLDKTIVNHKRFCVKFIGENACVYERLFYSGG